MEVLRNFSSDYWNKAIAGVIEVIPNKNGDMHALENVIKQLMSLPTVTRDPYVRMKLSVLEVSYFWIYGENDLTRNLFY